MKKSIVLALSLFIIINLWGQTEEAATGNFEGSRLEPIEIDGQAFIGGGLSRYIFSSQQGSLSKGYGITLGCDISTWYEYIGITTGLRYNSYSSKYKLDEITLSTPSIDGDIYNGNTPQEFTLNTTYSNFTEKLSGHYIGIPLMVSLRHTFDNDIKISGGIGTMFSFTAVSKSKTTDGSYTTEGYYPQYGENAIITEGPGFQTYNSGSTVQNNFKPGVSFIANADVAYKINDNLHIFGGPYFEYQLNSKKPDNKHMANYIITSQDEANVDYAGIANSNLTDKMKRMAFGLRVGLNFAIKKKRNSNKYNVYIPDNIEKKEVKFKTFTQAPPPVEIKKKDLKQDDFWYELDDSVQNRLKQVVRENSPIQFDRAGFNLTKVSEQRIKNIAAVLFDYPKLKITLVGHTCDIGGDEQNLSLGISRASSVAELLIEEGVSKHNLVIDSKGERKPVVPNTSEENRMKNRRVEFIIED